MAMKKKEPYIVRVNVRFTDTDANGHVNNGSYNAYGDEARFRLFQDIGMNHDSLIAAGIRPMLLRSEFEYKGEAFFGDIIRIETFVEPYKRTRALFHHRMVREKDEKVVCISRAVGVWLDLSTNRPVSLPDDAREILKNWVVSEPPVW